ncbi:uncharacterized protein B0P05DRAFT_552437 [Gilbertella persicaria]|uniref:uncharacterized protein n=1 Tax=Gilbertella persicaria TaxID=101096 RepID=UPI00221E6252|nr:uncharacterized protein B0P05DRAFT_552437 [Gilbertella persicaria]KAI8067654.1 hypothetical protein B0P05DRAFT_552437 [Gilbertella persicaria]
MEDNNTPEAPSPCTAGCGFYGSKIYNNMCSKCFKEHDERNKKDLLTTPQEREAKDTVDTKEEQVAPILKNEPDTSIQPKQEPKPTQKNKGRCLTCRSKIPLTKQLTNKCRCDYVFCDTHRYPDKHDCTFDHARNDKDILAKNNPKLNDKPRGGNSFNRIDSV